MYLSVIIPTCNRPDMLMKCLDLLQYSVQQLSSAEYELIVSDDSLDLVTKKLITEKYEWLTWSEGPKRGPAANRNNGAKKAKGDWLVFLDDDVLPDSSLLNEYIKAINAHPTVEAFEGAILPDNWDLLKKDMAECPVNTDGKCFWSANICIKSDLFNRINGFDEDYLEAAQEDQQIKINIEKNIISPIIFLPACKVVHPVRFFTVWQRIMKIKKASKNFSLFVNKNMNRPFTLFFISQWKFHFIVLIKHILSGRIKSAIVSLAWIFYGLPLNVYYINKGKS